MATEVLYQIPVNQTHGTIWLPCNGTVLLKLGLDQFRGSDTCTFAENLELLVSNPSLLVTIVNSVPPKTRLTTRELEKCFRDVQWLNSITSARPYVETKVFGQRKLYRRLSNARTKKQFWDALKKWAVKNRPGDANNLTKKAPIKKISAGFLKAVRRSATHLLSQKSTATTPPIDLAPILSKLSELKVLDDHFDDELLRQKLDSMRLLAYGASHEINNPLANIATRAQSLLNDEKDPKRKHRLTVIYEQSMRAHEMISDMMLFAHPPAPNLQQLELSGCVQTVIGELDQRLSQADIKCTIASDGNINVLADSTQIASAIKSLLINSMEAIGSQGKIEIRIETQPNGGVTLSIADDGPGIVPEINENIFDPFFSGREAGRGLGFGLSKAWRIAQLQNAKLSRVASQSGGAKFVFEFAPTASDRTDCRLDDPVPRAA